jgi:amino acid adenylation domain-containing protein/non-ribosomal peptide synthase protein (TIGR01720 family)
VVVTHANVARLMTSTEAWFGFGEDDVWTLYHSFAFDFSVWEIWGALLYGGRLVIVPYVTTRDYAAFYRLLGDEGVTVLNQTPSAFRQVMAVDEALGGGKGARDGSVGDGRDGGVSAPLSLRYVIFGGEALELQSLRGWIARHGDERPRLINMYGITETTVHVTYRRIRAEDVARGAGSVIGEPIPDLSLHVLEEGSLEPAPIGVAGELHVGGAGLARGYLGRAELTAARFVSDPFSDEPGARLYRSGDLARRLSDGDIEYLGRIDDQVKIRGFRIELGEIESVLAAQAAVREAVVVVSGREKGEARLVAYVVFRAGETAMVGELREQARRALPDYMVPAAFVVLDALPLTGNGKVDRRALPEPETGRLELGTRFVAAESAAEVALARIWADVLEVERVGVHDNFFALGGDSILSIRILTEAQKAGLALTVQQLFQYQTIAELARVAGEVVEAGARGGEGDGRSGSAEAEAFALVSEAVRARMPAGVVDAYPLTALQAGMLFHGDYDRGSAVFHDVFTQRLRMPWDEEKFAACWTAAVARHAVLRTSFALEAEGGPLQLVWASVAAPVVVGDWRGATEAEQGVRVRALVEERKHASFEWTRPPFFCVHLHRLSEDVAQFTIDFHHAILDGWSLATLVAEVFGAYLGGVRMSRGATVEGGVEASGVATRRGVGVAGDRGLKPTATVGASLCEAGGVRRGGGAAAPADNAFRRFVGLEAAARASEESRRFWSAQIEDGVFLRLPREAGLKVERTVHTEVVPIAAEVSEGLKRLAAEAGVPVKTVLLAAHLRVLSVLGGQRDVMTGVTLNGRPEAAGAERALGLFLNTLPVRVRLAEQSFVELVRAVFAAEQAVLPHRRFPLAEIQKLRGREPLFEAAFNFVHFHVYQDVLGREDFAPLGGEFYEETNFALIAHFSLDVFSGNVALELKADRRELSVAQSREIAGFYQRCLEIMARAPRAPVLTTSLLTAAERRKLLVEFNDTAADVPRVCVHERFERQAAATPGATAVVCDGGRLTYQELNDSANRLAHALRARGIGRGAMVAICMERSLEMIVALLGMLKSGAAYVPLDPKYPAERLRLMVRDAGARLVLTNSAAGRSGVATTEVPYLDLCDDAAALKEFSKENPTPAAGWDDLIYVIFTSGSTGRPKGAGVWHRGFGNLVDWYVKELELSAADSVLVIGSFTFDATHKNFYAPLVVGGTLNLLPPGPYDPEIIADLLEARKVTWLNCTPSAFFPLIEGDGAEARWAKLRTLRWLVLGGEPIPAARLERWLKESGCRTEVVNTYGPTEATDTTLYHWVTAEDLAAGGMIPTGRPPTNVALLIADDALQPCPLGVAGELVLAGDYVGSGYVGDPERTAAKFVANPHPELPGNVIYRTGDLVRYRADGVVEFLGRVDHQVKVRGFRVEPGEIDAVLSALPVVRQAITVTRPDPRGDNRLVAYVEFHAGKSATVTELREHLGAQLPEHMVPSQFVIMTAWPLSPNNKVDRHALPAPDEVAAVEDNYVEPRTENERVLARIWGEVLRRERVGATDGFFTLGGDSILSIQVVSKARAAGLEISARDVFEHPTLAELAAVAVSAKGKNAGVGNGGGGVSPVGGYSLSPVQQWFFEQGLAEPNHWNQAVLLEAKEAIDVRALEEAVNALVRHHDALRTHFVRSGEAWAGEVMPVVEGAAAGMRVVDFSAVTEVRLSEAIEEVANELQASLDIEAGELVRAAWMELGGGRGGRLLMVIHHLVVDGVSWRVLAADLLAMYAQARGGAAIEWPEKTAAYRAWAEGLKGVAGLSEEEAAYWARVVSGTPVAALPLDFAASEEAEREAHEAVVGQVLEPAETQGLLKDFAARQRTNVEEVLLTAVARVLTAWSGRTALWVDLESHGRDEIVPGIDVGQTVGWFTAMAPLRLELAGTRDAGEALKAVKEQVRALPRNGIGFGLVCRQSKGLLAEALRALPAREVVFNYLGQFDQALPEGAPFGVAAESAGRMRGARNRRTHRLQIVARAEGGRLRVEWSYSAKLHARETIAGLAEAFLAEVRGLIAAENGAALAPSDFGLMDLRPDELDDLVSDLEDAKG